MKTRKTLLAAALGASLLSATGAHAALTAALGGQGVYDDHLNITWLANANLAASNTFGVSGINANGTMSWYTAQNWIAGMNAANYLGFSDWRLPTALKPDATCQFESWGYNCTGSEMGHLFYNELGGVANSSILTTHNSNLALFQNVQSNHYWTGTDAPFDPAISVVFFHMTGYQNSTGRWWDGPSTLAVRDGNSIGVVPEPETYAMLLAGLGLLGFTARRRSRS